MDLKDFIQTAVTQIIEGVVAAQAAAAPHRVVVNPAIDAGGRGSSSPAAQGAASRVSNISFDIAVTGVDGSGAQGSGKLQVVGAWSAKAGAETQATAEPCTRLQFSLPIAFPEARLRRTSMASALDSEFLQTVDNGDSTWLPS